jgi:hypothetical protein
MTALSRLDSTSALAEYLTPRLQAIERDANLRGSVERWLAPLLKELPESVLLTAQGLGRLGLDEHQAAFVLLDSWRRSASSNYAHLFASAEQLPAVARSVELWESMRPTWISEPADFVVYADAMTYGAVVKAREEIGFHLQDLDGVTLRPKQQPPFENAPSLWRGERYLAHFDIGSTARWYASRNFFGSGSGPSVDIAALSLPTLDGLRRYLGSRRGRPKDGGSDVSSLYAAVKNALARRRALEAKARAILDRFETGAMDSLTGSLPPDTLGALARAALAPGRPRAR